MGRVSGKVAIVTGGASGVGKEDALLLTKEGAKVVLTDLNAKDGNAVAAQIGENALFVKHDISSEDGWKEVIARTEEKFGGVDILVNNAGIQHVAPVADFPDERWDAVIAINLSAAVHAAKAALPHMTAKGWGRIINIASAHGLVASAEKVAYVTAKHGLVGMTKVIAIEAANAGVTCNAICPGWVLTDLVKKQIEARAAAQGIPYQQAHDDLLREKQPMLRYTTPEKIGGLSVFLCSEAASTMTGAALSIDGGWVAQ